MELLVVVPIGKHACLAEEAWVGLALLAQTDDLLCIDPIGALVASRFARVAILTEWAKVFKLVR